MSGITAKVTCVSKTEQGESALLTFGADYNDGRNAEWAYYTPALSLTMTVRGEVAERFEQGSHYTLTFEPSE
jgi:hypothetical protein